MLKKNMYALTPGKESLDYRLGSQADLQTHGSTHASAV